MKQEEKRGKRHKKRCVIIACQLVDMWALEKKQKLRLAENRDHLAVQIKLGGHLNLKQSLYFFCRFKHFNWHWDWHLSEKCIFTQCAPRWKGGSPFRRKVRRPWRSLSLFLGAVRKLVAQSQSHFAILCADHSEDDDDDGHHHPPVVLQLNSRIANSQRWTDQMAEDVEGSN